MPKRNHCLIDSGFRAAAYWTIALVCGLAICGVPGAQADTPPTVKLAENGQAKLVIKLVDPRGDLGEAFLVEPSLEDLKQTLSQMTGGSFDLQTTKSFDASQPAIYVGLAEDLEQLVPQDLKLDEAYLRTTADGSLILSGNDSRSLSNAIYRLLFHLGARWYYPGEQWAVIPEKPTISVSFDARQQPDFPIQRRIWVGHGLRGSPRPAFDDWQRRNFVAQPFDVSTNHTWFGLNRERDFEAHPEWFAEVDGERRPSKPAYANPEVIQRGIDHALAYFENNPDAQMISLSPPDGLNYDTSELAKKQANVEEIFEAHGTMFGHQPDGRLVSVTSENVFHFVNEVARAVNEKHPGKMVGILAYSAYAHPPSFDIEPNVYVELTRGYRRTPLTSVEQIQAFAQKAENLGIYEYYDVEQWSWERPGRARASDLDYLQGSFQFYVQNNMRALSGEMSSNFGPYGVGYYVITRLLWDATQDVREIERAFYKDAFGPAADAMQRVYRRWESDLGLEPMEIAATYQDLAEATRLTEGMPEYQSRLDAIKMYAHFLKIYLQPKQHGTEADDVKAWGEKFGEEEAKQRVDALGDWVARITGAHVVHGQAFNRYFVRRGEEVGIDVKQWGKQGVPSHEEMATIFQRDLNDLKDVGVKPIAPDVYSQKLVSAAEVGIKLKAVPDEPAGHITRIRKGQLILKLGAGETATLTLGKPEGRYVISYLVTADFESGMGGGFATPVSDGEVDSETISIAADKAGYYFVALNGIHLRKVSHPHAMPQDGLAMSDGRLYFFVPAGIEHFILEAGAHRGATVDLYTPAGEKVVSQQGFAVHKADTDPSKLESRWLIDVPNGMADSIWAVEGPGDVNATNRPKLTGVPGYYALSPELLLVPREALRQQAE